MTSPDPSASTSRARPSNPVQGILWMLAGTVVFVAVTVLVRHLTQTYPAVEVVWMRFVVHFALVVLFLGRRLPEYAATKHPGLHISRSGLLFIATNIHFISLRYIPVAECTAIMLLIPIFVTLLSGPMIGETVGRDRWIGTVIGLTGGLTIVRPGTDAIHPVALLTIAGCVMFAVYQLATRRLSSTEGAGTTLFYTSVVGIIAGGTIMPFAWVTPDLEGWGLLIAMGVFGSAGQYALVRAFEVAPAAMVSPFLYTNIVWAMIFGLVAFDEFPDAWTLFGAGVITASGLFILRSARRGT